MLRRRNHIICIAAVLSSLRYAHAQDDETVNTTEVIATDSDNNAPFVVDDATTFTLDNSNNTDSKASSLLDAFNEYTNPNNDTEYADVEEEDIEDIETFDDANATLLEELDDRTTNNVFKLNKLNWTNIVLQPSSTCSETVHFCIDMPWQETSSPEELISAMKDKYIHFSDGWWNHIEDDVTNRYELYKSALKLGISAINDSQSIQTYGIGVVIDNVNSIDHLNNKFSVTMKIYLFKIEPEDPPESLKEAYGGARSKDFSVVRFENEDNVDQPYYELLKKKWSEVKDLPRYKEAQPVENNFCSRSYYKRMRLLTMEEYSALGPGLQIQHATSSPSAVADDQGNLLHLQASGVTILYDSPNSEMYPFQTDLLDINFYFPRGRQFDRIMFCVDNQYTGKSAFKLLSSLFHYQNLANAHLPGIMMPMEGSFGRTNDNQKDYLSLIPSIRSTFAPPFIGKTTQQMRNNYGDMKDLNNNGNKNVQLASFRILHVAELSDGAQAVLPFVFILLQTYAAWFGQSPESVVGISEMITTSVSLNTIVTAQKTYLLHRNKITNVIYLTYAVVMAKIIAASFMASVSISASSGKYPRIVRHRAIIFSSIRLLAFMSSLFLLPILLTITDPLTGQQSEYPSLYYLVAVLIIVVMTLFWLRAYRQHKKAKLELEQQDEEMANVTTSSLPQVGWTAEQVAHWIGHSEELRESASLTEGELEGIATKFLEGKVKGEIFAEVSNDRESLVEIGLSYGEAMLFVQSMNKMNDKMRPYEMKHHIETAMLESASSSSLESKSK